MTAKHADPVYRKNARLIRQQVRKARATGRSVTCWRCGHEIDPEQAFDVGHIDAGAGPSIGNLAPEHRYKIKGRCQGNRAAGGRLGAARQNTRRTATKGLLPW